VLRRLRALPAALLLGLAFLGIALAAVAVVQRTLEGPAEFPLPERPPKPPEYAKPLGAAVSLRPAQEDDAYRDAFLRTFTSVTPENAMKWSIVHPAPGRWEFGEADALVDMARRTGRRVRGHPLVWDQQLPAWAAEGDVEQNLRRHIRTLAARYRGRIDQWDAVNEPLEDDGTMTPNPFHRAMGERWIDVAFETARKADPKAKLFLNEIGAEQGLKLKALLALARRLKDRGVPIDGIGLQGHTDSEDYPRRATFDGALRAIEELGLKVEITELDVEGAEPKAFAAAAGACAAAPNCTGVTVWGVTDRWSWLGAETEPLPFDAEGRPKPALAALTRPLARDQAK
jgi:endo-1,4-beta-xylanase